MGNEPRLLIRPYEVLSRIADVAVLEVAHSSALAGESDKVVVPAILTTRPCKAVGKDAALLVLGKRLAQIGLGGAIVLLTFKLPRAGKIQPCLEVFGQCLLQQRAFGVAGG